MQKHVGDLNNGGSRSSILVRSGVLLSFYFPHKMFVAADIKFVGVLVHGMQKINKSGTFSYNAYFHPCV